MIYLSYLYISKSGTTAAVPVVLATEGSGLKRQKIVYLESYPATLTVTRVAVDDLVNFERNHTMVTPSCYLGSAYSEQASAAIRDSHYFWLAEFKRAAEEARRKAEEKARREAEEEARIKAREKEELEAKQMRDDRNIVGRIYRDANSAVFYYVPIRIVRTQYRACVIFVSVPIDISARATMGVHCQHLADFQRGYVATDMRSNPVLTPQAVDSINKCLSCTMS